MKLDQAIREEILQDLKDTAFINRSTEFLEDLAFNTSLLRDINSTYLDFYKSILEDSLRPTSFQFQATLQSQRNKDSSFDFIFTTTPDSLPPSNIHAIIGRNTCGKTQSLNSMSLAIFNKFTEERYPQPQTSDAQDQLLYHTTLNVD